jgi:acetyl-CoA acetyltransferase
MREVAVLGVGMHPWGKFPEKVFVDLGVKAVNDALDDAGIAWPGVEGVASGIYIWGGASGFVSGQQLARALGETGIPITNIYNMCATATAAFRVAYLMVAAGECDIALAVGLDVSPKGFYPAVGDDPTDVDIVRWKMTGITNPACWAIECRKRMEAYGTTETHLAKAKAVVSRYGALNPMARYKKEYKVDEILKSPIVCDPLRLYMITATSDGAAAAVLCSMDVARKHTTKPIIVAAASVGSCQYGDTTLRLGVVSAPAKAQAPLISESAAASRMAYKQAGIGPEDIDFVELPVNSSWHYLQYLETLGFCGPGEADHLLDEGATQIGGRIPVCPSGGVASFGEAIAAQGLAQVYEVVSQLRGRSGARQVEGAKVGMAQTYGMLGNSGTVILKT